MKKILFTAAFLAAFLPVNAQVSTIAGTGTNGYVEGAGSIAQFNYPNGIAVDKAGNQYIGDWSNHVIRKITPAGVVSTFAGTGIRGYKDGAAAEAEFNEPWGLAIDMSGNLYVGDAKNHRIRKITPAGTVSTLAGSGSAAFADGTGTAAMFDYPSAVGIDALGNIYVGDCNNQRVRKITPAGVVSTVAGNGAAGYADGAAATAQFHTPNGMVVSASGDIYVADVENGVIRKISGGMVTTFAGSGTLGYADGKGTAAQFNKPHGMVMDDENNLFIADTENNRVRKITQDGTVSTVTGSEPGYMDGPYNVALFYRPKCITKDAKGDLYLTDELNHRVRKLKMSTTGVLESHLSATAIYPNPASDAINIKCPVGSAGTRIMVYNAAGQLVLQQSVSTADHILDHRIDISGWTPGHYWLSIASGNMLESKMIVKY